jgi:LmbE family N-acetylglucosaminyl deacetylase
MNVLVVSAHPDDETIGMAGTLKQISKHHNVKVLFLSEGITSRRTPGYVSVPKYDVTDEEMNQMQKEIQLRKNQAKKALKLLGVSKMRFLDLPNLELDQIPLLQIIKEIDCDVIFTHHYNDLNIDHQIAFKASITAARPVPTSKISKIFSFEIPASTDWNRPYQFNPNFYVDISKELDSKVRALKAYKYEIRKFPHPRSQEATIAAAKRWGSLAGCNAAEAFEIIFSKANKIDKNFSIP